MLDDPVGGSKPVKWPFGTQRPVLTSLRSRLGKTAVIYPAAALNSIALGIANLGLVYFLRYKFGASAAAIGMIASAHSLAYFAACFLLRPFSSSLLPRYSLILSTGLNALFLILTLSSPSIGFVALFYSLSGLSLALFWPPMMGWVSTGLEGQKLNAALSKFNLSWSAGIIVSPYIAGYLTEQGRGLPFAVSAALYFSICLLVASASLVLHKVKTDRHVEPKKNRAAGSKDRSTPLRYPSWLSLLSVYAILGVLNVVLPIYGREVLGISERTVGLILLTRGVTTTIGFLVFGKADWWHFKSSPIIVTQVLAAGCVLLLGIVGSVGAYFLIVPVIGFLAAASYSFSVFHGASGSLERAKRMAIHEALLVAGMILGSSIGGDIYHRSSMPAVYRSILLFSAAAFAAQTILLAA